MAILPVNNIKNNNINFNGNEKENKKAKTIKNVALLTGAAAGSYGIYKGKLIPKAIKWLSEFGPMKKHVYPNYEKDNLRFMSMIGVSSIVLKDGLGCYLYVTQSLNNKEIPDDKRKFVAALDLTNGGLMIATQILAFFTISNKKVQEKIVKSLFGKKFTRSAAKALQAKLRQNPNLKDMTGAEFHKGNDAYKKDFTKAFGYLINLASATIFAKRMVVPFISTPLADKAKVWMSKNDKPAQIHKDTENTYDKNKISEKQEKQPEFQGSTNLLERIKNQ